MQALDCSLCQMRLCRFDLTVISLPPVTSHHLRIRTKEHGLTELLGDRLALSCFFNDFTVELVPFVVRSDEGGVVPSILSICPWAFFAHNHTVQSILVHGSLVGGFGKQSAIIAVEIQLVIELVMGTNLHEEP